MKKILIALYLMSTSLISMAQLPPTQGENSIQYIEGGVGSGESEAIEKDAKKWPLLLEFSQTNGASSEWVSGILLVIKDAAGVEVFSHPVDGPMILLNLKPGKYTIEASYGTQKKSFNFYSVSGQHQKMNINWK